MAVAAPVVGLLDEYLLEARRDYQAYIGLALRLLRDHLIRTIEDALGSEYPGIEPLEAARDFVDEQIQVLRDGSQQEAGRKSHEARPIREAALEDPRFLLTLLNLAGSTALGNRLSDDRSRAAARSLLRTRDAWAHFKPLSWDDVYAAFTDVITVFEGAGVTPGRDEAVALREELVAQKALYEGGGAPLLRAIDREAGRERAEPAAAEEAEAVAALAAAKGRLAEREQLLADAGHRQEAAENEADDARRRESEARRAATRAAARADTLDARVTVAEEETRLTRHQASEAQRRVAEQEQRIKAAERQPNQTNEAKLPVLPRPVLPTRRNEVGKRVAVGPALHAYSLAPFKDKRREVLSAVVPVVASLPKPQTVQTFRRRITETVVNADGPAVAAILRTLSMAGALVGPKGDRIAGGNADLVADIRPRHVDDLDLMCLMVYRKLWRTAFRVSCSRRMVWPTF